MRTLTIFLALFIAGITARPAYAGPDRSKGLSLHLLPERVAKIDGKKGGFTISNPDLRRAEAMTADEIWTIFQKLPDQVKANGIWVVYTHPSSYSAPEKSELKVLISTCSANETPIFTCRASELRKNGWKKGEPIE